MPDFENIQDNNSSRRSSSNGSPTSYRGEDIVTSTGDQGEKQGGAMNAQKITAGLLRFKWIILIATIAGGIAGWYHGNNETPLYRTSGTIILHHESLQPYYASGDLGSMLSRNLDLGWSRTLDDQLLLLNSRNFSEIIADRVMEQREMSNGELFPILFSESNPGRELNRNQIASLIRSRANSTRARERLIRVTYQSPHRRETSEMVNLIIDEYLLLTEYHSRASTTAINEYLQNVLIKQVEEQLEKSEFKVRDFMFTVEGGMNLRDYASRVNNRVQTLQEQIETAAVELDVVRSRQEELKKELNQTLPLAVDHIRSAVGPRLRLLQETIASLGMERLLILDKNPHLRENEENEPRLREINRNIQAYSNEIAEILHQNMESPIGFQLGDADAANRRVMELRRTLGQQVNEEERLLAVKKQAKIQLEKDLEEQKRLPDDLIVLSNLERQRDFFEGNYSRLVTRQMELTLLEHSTGSVGRVFDPATTPGSPFYPNVMNIILYGVLIGFGFSAGGVVVLVLTNKRIDSIDMMKKYDYPVLSVIPEIVSLVKKQFRGKRYYKVDELTLSTSLVSVFDPVSNIAEAYRRMYNNIRYNNPDHPQKVLVITSAAKAEGKTTCTANLGVTIAESGKRVLLVDADFRRPRLHRMFGISKEPGISGYLFEEMKLENAIVQTLVPGLDLLPAGKQPTSPGRAANSERMREMIVNIADQYDFVLIDSPPFGVITDAAPLIKLSDGVLCMSRFNRTTTPEINQLFENLTNIRAEIVGTVLMDYDPEIASGYYSYNKMYAYNYNVYRSYQRSDQQAAVKS